jgi:hypothetical protein
MRAPRPCGRDDGDWEPDGRCDVAIARASGVAPAAGVNETMTMTQNASVKNPIVPL